MNIKINMNIKKHLIILFVIFFTVSSAYAQLPADEIQSFVKSVQGSDYNYSLDPARFEEIWNGPAPILSAHSEQIDLLQRKFEESQDPTEKYNRLMRQRQLAAQAQVIVDRMFKNSSIVDINTRIVSLLHQYIFEPHSREALVYIVEAIDRHAFSPEERERLKNEANKFYQYRQGSSWTIFGAGLISIYSYIKFGRSNALSKWLKIAPKTAAETAVINAQKAAAMSDDVLRLGLKNRILLAMSKTPKKSYIRNTLYIFGIGQVGGVAGVGFYALSDLLFPKDDANTVFDITDLRDRLYDGLAVLDLSCKAYDFRQKLEDFQLKQNPPTNEQLKQLTVELNALYSEFSLQKRMTCPSPDQCMYLHRESLPASVRHDPQSGLVSLDLSEAVSLDLKIKNGINNNVSFQCNKLKGIKALSTEASLEEARMLILESLALLSASQ